MARKLQKLGIRTIGDLLYYFPFRYQDFSQVKPINQIKIGQENCVQGKIKAIQNTRSWKKNMTITEALIEDASGAIRAVWFNQPFLVKSLQKGETLVMAGKVKMTKNDIFLSSPVYEKQEILKCQNSEMARNTEMARLLPVYSETPGITSRWLASIIKPLVETHRSDLGETLPQDIVKQNDFLSAEESLKQAHFPDSLAMAEKAKTRFAFEELLLIELSVLKARLKLKQHKAPAIALNAELMKKFTSSLPFQLTDSQKKCAWQILKDIEKPCPMSRLLEGDVGSGKTVVALMAALNTIKAGFQVGFMAPTEILAKQHFFQTAKLLHQFKIKIALLTGKEDQIISQKLGYQTKDGFRPETIAISRTKILERTKKEEIDLLIGTHTLIQDKVKFGKLGLVIVDEQHRFGIAQRAQLTAKSGHSEPRQLAGEESRPLLPHLLSMTATPIPRTLALTIFGDLDLSLLDEMPKGRKEIITKIISPQERQTTYKFIRQQVKKDQRVFVICPRIEQQGQTPLASSGAGSDPSRWSEAKAVKTEYEKLSKEIFPDLKVGMLHGKMKPKEKEKIMQDFKRGKIEILVSTSVVEVGVDISKATVMMIEGAEMFGLAQLHQFRGRVGRANEQSYCFLFTQSASKNTKARLTALSKAKNGFELAQKDLDIRGPGALWGKQQWGVPDLAMANLSDLALVKKTRQQAKEILSRDPNLKTYPGLRERVKTIEKQLHLE